MSQPQDENCLNNLLILPKRETIGSPYLQDIDFQINTNIPLCLIVRRMQSESNATFDRLCTYTQSVVGNMVKNDWSEKIIFCHRSMDKFNRFLIQSPRFATFGLEIVVF